MTQPEQATRRPNRLIREKSPYLLQHAYNPVEWYPWGEEALQKARAEHKPIFLSIGYSTCHWCHVMERESFEDPTIAQLMNQSFVNIKVDREEHPDLDHLYMSAVMMLSGQGGWPLSVFLTPDLKPFFGGTYFPPERRGTMPGMTELLPSVAKAWEERRQEILQSAEQVAQTLSQQLARATPPSPVTADVLDAAFNQAVAAFDESFGGFGEAPKFPRAHELSFLLHYWARTHSRQALEMVTTTLDHLARGGIHDHLGGGFHRYATDRPWLIPHFEKMLYDQALVARACLEAYRVTRREEDADVARGILDDALRDFSDPQGGFYAAHDADSEGEEGRFYVWTPDEVIRILGPEEGELFNRFYGVSPQGNFEHGRSILNVGQPLEAFAALKGIDRAQLAARLANSRATLLAARNTRVKPHRDDKILTSWNGLMVASLAYGAATLTESRYLQAARRAADFLLTTLLRDGVVLRRYRDGEARYPGTLEDYAFLSYGLLELYEASFEPSDLAHAKQLAEWMVERFWDEAHGGFFLRAPSEPQLIARIKEIYDGATPSGNSIAVLVLLRLGHMTQDEELVAKGRRSLEAFAQEVARGPFGYPQLLIAWDFALGPTAEVVIAGEPNDPRTATLLHALRQRFLPRTVTLLHPPGPSGQGIEALAPFVKVQGMLQGQPTAYVCQGYVCRLPTSDVEVLVKLLEEAVDQRRPL